MSTLQMKFMETVEGLSDDTMRMLLEVVKQVVLPLDHKELGGEKRRVLGIADGKYSIPDNIDECNDEIAEMFGVNQI